MVKLSQLWMCFFFFSTRPIRQHTLSVGESPANPLWRKSCVLGLQHLSAYRYQQSLRVVFFAIKDTNGHKCYTDLCSIEQQWMFVPAFERCKTVGLRRRCHLLDPRQGGIPAVLLAGLSEILHTIPIAITNSQGPLVFLA